jgi:hypothetical protein
VQRPEAVRQIALDWTCLALALEALEAYWRKTRPSGFTVSLGKIADEIASNLFQVLMLRYGCKCVDLLRARKFALRFSPTAMSAANAN